MFRALSARLRAASAAALLCVLSTTSSSDAGSIFHRRTPAPAATGSQPTVILVPQQGGTYLYTLPGSMIPNPFAPTPWPTPAPDASGGTEAEAMAAGLDMTFTNEVATLARDPQYLWLAGRLGGDPTRVKALKDHLRVVLLREIRKQNGRVQAINWPKFLENAAILFLKVTYAFNAANPWEPALAIIQRLIVDILREEGLLKPDPSDCPPTPAAPSVDPAPSSRSARARILGTVDVEILDPSPDLIPAPVPAPTPAPVPAPTPAPTPDPAPHGLPEPLPQNDDAAPPPPAIP